MALDAVRLQRRFGTGKSLTFDKLRFRRRSKDCRPSGPSFNFGRGGRRDFVLRATKIVLTEPAAIHGSNSRRRSRLARNCDGCIFEFFNRIGHEQSLDGGATLGGVVWLELKL